LNKMAIDVCKTIFRVLNSIGVVLGAGFFNTLRAAFLREAQDHTAVYHDDALINGLLYDRHAEATAIEMFAEAIRIAGEVIQENPLGPPLIPNWNRVFSAIPNFAPKLIEYVDQDCAKHFD
jgi:glucosyl-3-phosphoglycerate synthase